MITKTDWKVSYDSSGNYIGDYFEFTDYNRIKSNYDELFIYINHFFNIQKIDMITINNHSEYPTANLFNSLENNAKNVYNNSVKIYPVYNSKTWYPNQSSPNYEDINRLEKFCGDYNNVFENSYKGLKRLSFKLGGSRF